MEYNIKNNDSVKLNKEYVIMVFMNIAYKDGLNKAKHVHCAIKNGQVLNYYDIIYYIIL